MLRLQQMLYECRLYVVDEYLDTVLALYEIIKRRYLHGCSDLDIVQHFLLPVDIFCQYQLRKLPNA